MTETGLAERLTEHDRKELCANLKRYAVLRHTPPAIRTLMLQAAADLASTVPGAVSPEVRVKPLEWDEADEENLFRADSIIGTFEVGFDDGWYATLDNWKWEWEPEQDCRSYEGPSAAQAGCQEYLKRKIASALSSLQPAPASREREIRAAAEAVIAEAASMSMTMRRRKLFDNLRAALATLSEHDHGHP